MRLADLTPGDIVEHSTTGFRWVVLRVESVTRVFQWAPLPSVLEIQQTPIKPRWSPPHDLESWEAEVDAHITRRRR